MKAERQEPSRLPPEALSTPPLVRRAGTADARASALMIERGFSRFIAQDYGPIGQAAFRMFASDVAIRRRLARGTHAFVATLDQDVLGYAELRGHDRRLPGFEHLSLLFTDPAVHRRGYARALLEAVREELARRRPAVTHLTVNAAPSAVCAYRRLGFRAESDVIDDDGGVLSYRMCLRLISSS